MAKEHLTSGINREPLILASASPRRIELLKQLGLALEVIPSGIEEGACDGEQPGEHVLRLAVEKTDCISEKHPEAWVLGADTIVYIDEKILGKPHSPQEAKAMLRSLSGRTHQVFTGYAIVRRDRGQRKTGVVESRVLFREITPDELNWYVASDEPYDKAGAYAVQGRGAFFIKGIQGSFTNVMGLPLCEVVSSLKELGIIDFSERKTGLWERRSEKT